MQFFEFWTHATSLSQPVSITLLLCRVPADLPTLPALVMAGARAKDFWEEGESGGKAIYSFFSLPYCDVIIALVA